MLERECPECGLEVGRPPVRRPRCCAPTPPPGRGPAAAGRGGAPPALRRPLVGTRVRLPRAGRLLAVPPPARPDAGGRPAVRELGPGRHRCGRALRRAGSRPRVSAARGRRRAGRRLRRRARRAWQRPARAATAPTSPSRGSPATCCTTQCTTSTTSPGVGGPEPRTARAPRSGGAGARAGSRWMLALGMVRSADAGYAV